MIQALAFLRRDWLTETSYRLSFVLQIAGILVNVFTFYFVARLFGAAAAPFLAPYGGDYFAFVLIGLAFSGYFSLGLTSFGSAIRQAQMSGTLEAMLMTPTGTAAIVLGSSLWEYAIMSVRVLLYLAIGAVLGNIDLSHVNLGAGLIVLVLAILVFSALGVLASSVILIAKRGDPVTWLANMLFVFLGGVYYPTTILPGLLQPLAELIPMTPALRALRLALLQGASVQTIAPDLLVLLLFAIVLIPLCLVAFQYAIALAKREGSLSQY